MRSTRTRCADPKNKRHPSFSKDSKVIQNIGLCICLWDMLKASEGLISQASADGVNVNGKANPESTDCGIDRCQWSFA